jgi:hypothetical protein
VVVGQKVNKQGKTKAEKRVAGATLKRVVSIKASSLEFYHY